MIAKWPDTLTDEQFATLVADLGGGERMTAAARALREVLDAAYPDQPQRVRATVLTTVSGARASADPAGEIDKAAGMWKAGKRRTR